MAKAKIVLEITPALKRRFKVECFNRDKTMTQVLKELIVNEMTKKTRARATTRRRAA